MSTTAHLRLRGVSKAYRFFQLQGISFDLEPGEVLGLVGPNGAGKSTTIRMAMGMQAPDAGEIRVLGHAMPAAQADAKRDIGYVSTDMRLVPNATLGWHMAFVAASFPGWDADYAATLLRRFNLQPQQSTRTLSQGEQVKAAMLLALARRPRLLLLDEPGNGLDPVARQELLAEFMEVLRDDSRSILFSSHNTVDVERISDRIAFMDRGRLLECSDKEAFLERWRRIEVQLAPGAALPALPDIVAQAGEGRIRTLTTNRFDEAQLALLGGAVQGVQRMSLEEIFVANVMHHREVRTP